MLFILGFPNYINECQSSPLSTINPFIFPNWSSARCFIRHLVRAYSGVFSQISNVNDLHYYISPDTFLPIRASEMLQTSCSAFTHNL